MRHPTELAHEAAATANAQLESAADTIGLAVQSLLADNGLVGEVEVTATVTLRKPDGTIAGGPVIEKRGNIVYPERASGDVLELG